MEVNVLFVLIFSFIFVSLRGQDTDIRTRLGVIRGRISTVNFGGKTYELKQFLGIPYAKAPVGDLRFRKPEALNSLESPFDATQYGFICPQIVSPDEPLVGKQDEDCLHLNIFVPTQGSDSSTGHAVMVWIHGGAFILGSSDEYDGKIIAGYGNVIIVTINYRLGPLGFLSTMDSNCPGNFGLWDQTLALNWIRDNIDSFGGDTDRVTVFGESAGAVSGIMQGMLPENNGLFKRIIAQSGSPSVRSMNCSRNTLTRTTYIAGKMGCASADTAVMINCLRNVSWEDYMAAINALNNNFEDIEYVIFDPVVDGDFIKHEPRDIYKHSKSQSYNEIEFFKSFDLLSGMNQLEGAYYITFFVGDQDPDQFKPTREEMRKLFLPMATDLVYNRTFPDSVMRLVESEYTNWTDPEDFHNIRLQYAKIFGDTGFAVPTVEFARLHMTSPPTSKTYVYKFMPRPSKRSAGTPVWTPGANHADDLGFVFGFHNQPNAEAWEIELSKHMMRYWTNFAKTGNPNSPMNEGPVWQEYDINNQHYMELNKNLSTEATKQYVFARETNFWLEIFPSVVTSVDRQITQPGACDINIGHTLSPIPAKVFALTIVLASFIVNTLIQ